MQKAPRRLEAQCFRQGGVGLLRCFHLQLPAMFRGSFPNEDVWRKRRGGAKASRPPGSFERGGKPSSGWLPLPFPSSLSLPPLDVPSDDAGRAALCVSPPPAEEGLLRLPPRPTGVALFLPTGKTLQSQPFPGAVKRGPPARRRAVGRWEGGGEEERLARLPAAALVPLAGEGGGGGGGGRPGVGRPSLAAWWRLKPAEAGRAKGPALPRAGSM